MKPERYEILTWDSEAQAFSPQPGVSPGPYALFELRAALRHLRSLGYVGDRSDPSILARRLEPTTGG